MKRIFSACIIFAFLLTSFTGCGKLKNVPLDLSQSEPLQQFNTSVQPDNSDQSNTFKPPQTSEPSNTLNKDNVLVPLDITQQPDNSSEIEIKDLTEKESWKEWTCRQWNDNKRYWIGGISAVVSGVVIAGVYCYGHRTISADFPLDRQNLDNQNQAEVQPQEEARFQETQRRIAQVEEEIQRSQEEYLRIKAELQENRSQMEACLQDLQNE